MDDRILHDPHLELIPDHAGPHYDILRNALTQNGMTVDQAVQALNCWIRPIRHLVEAITSPIYRTSSLDRYSFGVC